MSFYELGEEEVILLRELVTNDLGAAVNLHRMGVESKVTGVAMDQISAVIEQLQSCANALTTPYTLGENQIYDKPEEMGSYLVLLKEPQKANPIMFYYQTRAEADHQANRYPMQETYVARLLRYRGAAKPTSNTHPSEVS